jgi:hypothetical protein
MRELIFAVVCLDLYSLKAVAQKPNAQRPPAVRLLDAPSAVSAHVFGSPATVRELAGRGLLINDTERRQVIAVDAKLGGLRIVADSAGGSANWYGPRAGGLIRYVADSTLFVDPVGLSMLVFAPDGHVARTASVPRSQDASQLTAAGGAAVGIDALGRLLYRAGIKIPTLATTGLTMGATPDSTEIDRVDMKSRKLDTAAYFKTFKVSITATQTEKGLSATGIINPIQTVDDWAVLADGTIAIVRGVDYHVDFISTAGAIFAGPKIPFDWRPISDERKVAILDSVKAVMSAPPAASSSGATGQPSGHSMAMMHGSMAMTMTLAPASDLPDYYPAFEQDAARGDADGNLWVRTTATRDGAVGGPIYDVVSRTGELLQRVQLPGGRRIIGFGKNGVVYLAARDASGAWIEKTRRPQ